LNVALMCTIARATFFRIFFFVLFAIIAPAKLPYINSHLPGRWTKDPPAITADRAIKP